MKFLLLSVFIFSLFVLNISYAGNLLRLSQGNISDIKVSNLECAYNHDYVKVEFTFENKKTYIAKILITEGDGDYECNTSDSTKAYKELLTAFSSIQSNSISIREFEGQIICGTPVLVIAVNEDTSRYSSYSLNYIPQDCYQ